MRVCVSGITSRRRWCRSLLARPGNAPARRQDEGWVAAEVGVAAAASAGTRRWGRCRPEKERPPARHRSGRYVTPSGMTARATRTPEKSNQGKSINHSINQSYVVWPSLLFWCSAVYSSSMTPITGQAAVDDKEQRPLLQDILEAAVDGHHSCQGKIAEVVSRCLPRGLYFCVTYSWIVS